jgi:drug/metabolite transporter (DMT)-like permease
MSITQLPSYSITQSPMAILWGLAAAISFGTADVLARFGSEQEGTWRTLFYLQFIGCLVAVLFVVIWGVPMPWAALWGRPGVMITITSAVMLAGTATLYRCLVIGPMLITSPIASSFAAVTALLALLTGERPSALQIAGLGVTLVGVALTAASDTSEKRPVRWLSLGVLLALATAGLHGIAFFLLDGVVASLGEAPTVLALRLITLTFLVTWLGLGKRPLHLDNPRSLRWLMPLGLLDTLANLFYNLGLATGLTSVVSVLTALYSVVTVLIGTLWLKERITTWQKLGVLIVFVGVGLVNV